MQDLNVTWKSHLELVEIEVPPTLDMPRLQTCLSRESSISLLVFTDSRANHQDRKRFHFHFQLPSEDRLEEQSCTRAKVRAPNLLCWQTPHPLSRLLSSFRLTPFSLFTDPKFSISLYLGFSLLISELSRSSVRENRLLTLVLVRLTESSATWRSEYETTLFINISKDSTRSFTDPADTILT